ncbi:MAG: creatininase family protein [Myxococcales bacterium]|nr:creatininase family protein [Myxococcales bacterium]MCB9735952.1 creatininase family protein [Deltaproteobacteria bacterium]
MDAAPYEPLAWQHLRGPDVAALDRARTIVWVAVSPLEVHGPHLPTATDVVEARGFGRAIMQRFAERFPEVTHVELPAYHVAADVLPHAGSVAFRPATVRRVVEDVAASLARQGFRHVWLTNFHAGPRHLVAMEVAADAVSRRHGARVLSVFSLLLAHLNGGSQEIADVLGPLPGIARDDLVGDAHGGALETSLMLHLLGEHVAADYAALPPRTVAMALAAEGRPPLPDLGGAALGALVRRFRETLAYYHRTTYAGAPGKGSAAAGEAALARLGSVSADALAEVWLGRVRPEDLRSPLWKARHLLMAPLLGDLFERWATGEPPRV